MSALSTNARVLSEAIMHAVRRRRGIGPRHARKLADVLTSCAGSLERQELKVEKLTAIVRDIAPTRLPKKTKRSTR